MLTKSQILDLCVAFDCNQEEIFQAEEEGERLIEIHGIDGVEGYLDDFSRELCLGKKIEESDKLLLIKYVIKAKYFSSVLHSMT